MSTQTDKKPDWKTETPAQRLSNKTILRFQCLADELKNDLARIFKNTSVEKPSVIQEVLFVSADRSDYRFPQERNLVKRNYNLRLLQTFRFTDEIPKLWKWIEARSEAFQELFDFSSKMDGKKMRYQDFADAVLKADPEAKEAAHRLLIEALADMAYTGVLPSAFDNSCFRNRDWEQRHGDRLFLFEADKKGQYRVWKRTKKKDDVRFEDQPELEFPEIRGTNFDGLSSLSKNFINHFSLGIGSEKSDWKDINDNAFGISPYHLDGKMPYLAGFCIPVYDFNDKHGNPAGGFEGWLMVIEFTVSDAENTSVVQKVGDGEWLLTEQAITMAVQNFSSRVSEERMRELVEHEWTDSMSPEDFTLKKYQYVGGWTGVELGTHDLIPSKERYQWLDEYLNRTEASNPKQITYIAVRVRERGPTFIFRKLEDTILPSDPKYLQDYAYHVARTVKDLHKAADLREKEKKQSQQAGFLASAHDYSKDLNALDIRLGHYQTLLDSTRLEIKSDTAKLSLPDQVHNFPEIADRIDLKLDQLQQPQLNWMLQKRFLISHQRTQTENRLYEQPEWCMQFVQGGTLRDLYHLCKVLVWLPVGHQGYKKLAEEEPDQFSDSWNWARLFAFEEGDSSDQGKRLAVKLASVIRERFQRGNYTNKDFTNDFPPPTLKSHPQESLDIQLLWSGFQSGKIEDRWLPIRGLLPLLVFSLRAAFQHAWLRTVLDAAEGNPGNAQRIRIHADEMEKDTGHRLHYLIHIDFPCPDSESAIKTNLSINLPYGDWHKQVAHYRKLSFPWSVVTPVVTQHKGEAILRITLKAYA